MRRRDLERRAARLPLPGRHHGLVQSQGADLAVVEHDGCRLLRRRPRGGDRSPRQPDIFNTDQGSQFTSFAFTTMLKDAGIRMSMDGRGRWRDNVFIERLWRSLKYECVFLNAFETGSQAGAGIGSRIDYYSRRRPHSAFNGRPIRAIRLTHHLLQPLRPIAESRCVGPPHGRHHQSPRR